ncbi:phage tail tape measure protein [Pseudomonas lactis]|uniref:phage tail tape measure protein n=1 Tax=Pseudomonas lactis TaxID=1615674 RepID=UPI0007173343|nr:phage tail tape measure protein [Pseudomonas lactis]
MTQTSRLVLEIDSRDAEQKASDTRKALEALESAGLRVKPAMDKAGGGLDRAGKSAAGAEKTFASQREEIERLLGRIDPLSKKLGELDRQEQELARHRKAGTIDTDTYTDYQQKITTTRNELTRFSDSLTRTGNTAKQTAAALRGVPAQFTDIAVSLQGGQAPLTVFLQQGGQLKDMFGGVGPAAKALGGYVVGLVNPFTIAAAAVGVLGLALYDAEKEASEFNKALFSGSANTGKTTIGLSSLAKDASSLTGSFSEAKAAVIALSGVGRLSEVQFSNLAKAAVSIGEFTGKSAAEVAKSLGDMGKNATEAAQKVSSQYGLLSSAQYEVIAALDKQGKTQEALDVLSEALNKNAETRLAKYKASLSGLEKAWDDVGTSISNAYRNVRSELFPDSAKEIEIIERILKTRQEGGLAGAVSSGLSKLNSSLGLADGVNDDSNEALQKRLASLKAQAELARSTAAAEGEATRAEQAKIEAEGKWGELVKKNLNDRARLEDDIKNARKLGLEAGRSQVEIDKEILAIQEKFEKSQAKTKAYREDAGMKALDQARQQYAVLKEQNSLIGVQKGEVDKLGAAGQALIKWEQELADIKTKKTLTADQKSLVANQELITAQLKKNAALEKEGALRKIANDETQKLAAFQTNLASQLSKAQIGLDNNLAGMGMGDQMRQRLQEQLSIQQQYQTQLDALEQQHNEGRISDSLYGKETEALRAALQQRLTMQQGYYSAVDQAQSDWSLGASSALQTYAEQANDVAGQTRNLFTNAFGNMEDAVVNFVKTGKLSFKDFADGVVADLIRIQVRQAAAGFLGMAFGAITGGGGAALGPAVMTGSSQTISRVGFSGGGYTGDGGKFEPKGVVHGGEFVVKKEVVSQPGAREFLERMNANSNGYADGGYVNPTPAAASSSTTQSIATNGGSPTITQQFSFQGNPDDATISLVKDAAYQGAKGGYEMVMRDLKQNGPIRQLIARR